MLHRWIQQKEAIREASIDANNGGKGRSTREAFDRPQQETPTLGASYVLPNELKERSKGDDKNLSPR